MIGTLVRKLHFLNMASLQAVWCLFGWKLCCFYLGHRLLTWMSFILAWLRNNIPSKMCNNSILKLQRVPRWSIGMDK